MIGIVGNGTDKWTIKGYLQMINVVRYLIKKYNPEEVCSGDSPMLGVDKEVKLNTPENRYKNFPARPLTSGRWSSWKVSGGYRDRNLQIAESRIVFVIVADSYPAEYRDKREKICYHCKESRPWHCKSGACWTGLQAMKKGNKAIWVIIPNYGTPYFLDNAYLGKAFGDEVTLISVTVK